MAQGLAAPAGPFLSNEVRRPAAWDWRRQAILWRRPLWMTASLAVVAAVATPTPDPVTMLLAMAPLLVLFELSVLLARIFERRRARAEPEERWDLDDDLSLS